MGKNEMWRLWVMGGVLSWRNWGTQETRHCVRGNKLWVGPGQSFVGLGALLWTPSQIMSVIPHLTLNTVDMHNKGGDLSCSWLDTQCYLADILLNVSFWLCSFLCFEATLFIKVYNIWWGWGGSLAKVIIGSGHANGVVDKADPNIVGG